jgi:hypothetical protein
VSKNDLQTASLESTPKPTKQVRALLERFADKVEICELSIELPLTLWHDERSNAIYTVCHMTGKTLCSLADLDAAVDPEESEDYKLNRELYTDNYAYRLMEADAQKGRSFEDIVVEYDETYRPKTPLKVFGGQHRIEAIRSASEKGARPHGVRVYFGLTVEQRVDIATANNTSIAISNDLLDRMQEDLLGTELRDWAQAVGLLQQEMSFADRRDSAGRPTVRIARTFVVNYHAGLLWKEKSMPDPYVCRSAPRRDERYQDLRSHIVWDEAAFQEAGREFVALHRRQRETVLNRTEDSYLEFANKSIHPCVGAAWAYTAGMLQREKGSLANHYALAQVDKGDPLNAAALLRARLKGVDPDTYRGLGSRINQNELGRMVQVFVLQATRASKRGITPKVANAAIKAFEALRATAAADKATEAI